MGPPPPDLSVLNLPPRAHLYGDSGEEADSEVDEDAKARQAARDTKRRRAPSSMWASTLRQPM